VRCQRGKVRRTPSCHQERFNWSIRRHRPHNLAKAVGYVAIPVASGHEARRNLFLDAQGLELVENQKESLVGRKALADRTKGA
jgi:hypothetical protein